MLDIQLMQEYFILDKGYDTLVILLKLILIIEVMLIIEEIIPQQAML